VAASPRTRPLAVRTEAGEDARAAARLRRRRHLPRDCGCWSGTAGVDDRPTRSHVSAAAAGRPGPHCGTRRKVPMRCVCSIYRSIARVGEDRGA